MLPSLADLFNHVGDDEILSSSAGVPAWLKSRDPSRIAYPNGVVNFSHVFGRPGIEVFVVKGASQTRQRNIGWHSVKTQAFERDQVGGRP